MRIATIATLIVAWVFTPAHALDWKEGSVLFRVVDVGAGECCVVKIAGKDGDNHYLVLDTGNFQDRGNSAIRAIREMIPEDERIDLLVLTHPDSDHHGGTPKIVDEYFIDRVIRTGQHRDNPPKTLTNSRAAIKRAVDEDDTIDINLSETDFPNGATYRLGHTFVTMICGFGSIPDGWDIEDDSERRNATSICIRIVHKGKSILFCGDAVGRHNGGPTNQIIATELHMIKQRHIIPIDSDVIIAPHHGADNGSSTDFIQAVSPNWVVFSAGEKFQHPRQITIDRYKAAGVLETNMLRTDLGDKSQPKQWNLGSTVGGDRIGDDDVDVLITKNGTLKVEYRNPVNNGR